MEISINGAQIYGTIPIFGGIPISASLVNAWVVMAIITGLCIWLTRGLKVENIGKRQAVAELLVTTCQNFVNTNMGEHYRHFAPFIGALFSLSAFCSLTGYGGSFHRAVLGGAGVLHDYLHQNQNQRCGRLSQGIYHPHSRVYTL